MPSSLSSNLSLCVNHGFGKGHIVLYIYIYICIYIYGKVARVKGVLHKKPVDGHATYISGIGFFRTTEQTHGKHSNKNTWKKQTCSQAGGETWAELSPAQTKDPRVTRQQAGGGKPP